MKIEDAWERQRKWSVVASNTATSLRRWRATNLSLIIAGAVLGAAATQIARFSATFSTVLGVAGAVALAIAGFVQTKLLTADRVERWKTARAASESLKSLCYQYLIGVAPFAGPDRQAKLAERVKTVRERAKQFEDQLPSRVDIKAPTMSGITDYVSERAVGQRDWHRNRIEDHRRKARLLRGAELLATAVAAVLAAIGGVAQSSDLTLWVSVATTVGAAIAAHLGSTQHERIVSSYAATTGDLDELLDGFDPNTATAEQQAQFVADVEHVLAAQNEGWASVITAS